ncbi:MAG: hypothetical protein H6737_12445 [Alphaproteobacteria bacterium]|nr:hypothetical protein [Alphaproteobacteria bacterium]
MLHADDTLLCDRRAGGEERTRDVAGFSANGRTTILHTDGSVSAGSPFPLAIPGLVATQVVSTPLFACALRDDGRVVCWGGRDGGRMVLAAAELAPFEVEGLEGVQRLTVGAKDHVCAETATERLCWGRWHSEHGLPHGVGAAVRLPRDPPHCTVDASQPICGLPELVPEVGGLVAADQYARLSCMATEADLWCRDGGGNSQGGVSGFKPLKAPGRGNSPIWYHVPSAAPADPWLRTWLTDAPSRVLPVPPPPFDPAAVGWTRLTGDASLVEQLPVTELDRTPLEVPPPAPDPSAWGLDLPGPDRPTEDERAVTAVVAGDGSELARSTVRRGEVWERRLRIRRPGRPDAHLPQRLPCSAPDDARVFRTGEHYVVAASASPEEIEVCHFTDTGVLAHRYRVRSADLRAWAPTEPWVADAEACTLTTYRPDSADSWVYRFPTSPFTPCDEPSRHAASGALP